MKFPLFLVALLLSSCLFIAVPAQNKNTKQTKPPDAAQPEQPAPPVDSEEDLRNAIQSAGGNQIQIIENLEGYLKKYPQSAHRGQIERELFKMTFEMRDRARALSYGERVVAGEDKDIEVLTDLISLLRERRANGDLQKALGHADQMVKQVEKLVAAGIRPKRLSAAQWKERQERALASAFLLRGKVNADLNDNNAATRDLQKSFQLARLAGAVMVLGELAERRKDTDEALECYAQAFILSLTTDEELDRQLLRRKLGELFASKHKSETGLGDKLLKAYDSIAKERAERLAKLNGANPNEGVTDPLQFRLTKLDGSAFKLADHQGKVVVVNFWATWCGPCLTEMPLLEKTAAKYKDDKDVLILALSTDEERSDVQPFLRQHKFNLPVAYAETLNDHLRVNSIPTTIIFDRQGQIAFRQAGFNPREDFVAKLSERIEATKKR